MQLMVEPSSAALAAERADAQELEQMHQLATYEYNVEDKNSYHEFLQTNYQLHSLIAFSTRNSTCSPGCM